jgi:L-ascorbate metabolism protein UlaG (beta-lactamase superfamily)
MYLTWLDSNSWMIELGGQRILLDPWLVGSLVFGNLPWLFKGDRPVPRSIPENIDLILLSQGLEDHTHPATLAAMDRGIPVVGSPNAVQVAQGLGYSQVTALAHGETITFANRIQIQATPGSPIGPFLRENGYLLRDLQEGTSLYYEPHGYHPSMLKELAPVDVVVAPVVDLTVPLLGPIIQGHKTALSAIEMLQPQVFIPTAAGGDVRFGGLINAVLQAKGSAAELQATLAQRHQSTQVLEPKPGDRFHVPLLSR